MKTLRISALLMALIYFIPNSYAANQSAKPQNSSVTNVMRPVKYKVRRGDGLAKIARKYNLSVSELVSKELNPQFAKRNINKIYVGEEINLPLFRKEIVTPRVFRNSDLAVFSKSEIVKNSQITEQRNKTIKELTIALNSTRGWLLLFTGLYSVSLAVFFIFMFMSKKMMGSADKIQQEVSGVASNPDAFELIKLLQKVDGKTLATMANLAVTNDELGNPVTIKKIIEFLNKRPYLADLPVASWDTAMKTRETSPAT